MSRSRMPELVSQWVWVVWGTYSKDIKFKSFHFDVECSVFWADWPNVNPFLFRLLIAFGQSPNITLFFSYEFSRFSLLISEQGIWRFSWFRRSCKNLINVYLEEDSFFLPWGTHCPWEGQPLPEGKAFWLTPAEQTLWAGEYLFLRNEFSLIFSLI